LEIRIILQFPKTYEKEKRFFLSDVCKVPPFSFPSLFFTRERKQLLQMVAKMLQQQFMQQQQHPLLQLQQQQQQQQQKQNLKVLYFTHAVFC